MYLSKPILFVIIVVVLFIGGTSGLIHHVVENGSKHRNSKRIRSDNRNDKSDSSSSSESDSSDSDSDSDERRIKHILSHKIRNSQNLLHGFNTGPGTRTEGFTASNNVKCMPGCKIATSVTGNCEWLPKSEPKHKQRLICPHTCDTGFKPPGGGVTCETNLDCSDCTPQPDFTVVGYTSFSVKQTTPNANCLKGARCNIESQNALTVCNPYISPNNPAQNLVCAKKPGSETEYVWTEPDAAAKQIPFHADQAKLLACDAKQGCAVDGDTCINANFDKLYCKDNIWVTDPKYDKSTYSTDKKGTGNSSSSSSSSSTSNSNSSNTGNSDSAANENDSSELRDNYYITNYFFGPSKDAESSTTYKLGLGLGVNNKNKNDKNERLNKNENNSESTKRNEDNEKKPGVLDRIKGAFKKEQKVDAEVGLGLYGNNYGVGGNATVPPLVPKGTVATVQAYESTIKL
jgi:hypothetical protein